MDPVATLAIGFVSSCAVIVVAQFIIAARSSKEKLETANNNALVSKMETLDTKIMGKLDKISDGQAAMNKELESIKRRISVLKKKLDKAERDLEEAQRQLKERQSESNIKSQNIEKLKEEIGKNEESIRELKALYKKMEQWQGMKNVTDIVISKEH